MGFLICTTKFKLILDFLLNICVQVGYEIGANCQSLSSICINDLDEKLVPILSDTVRRLQKKTVILEFVFYVLEHAETVMC